VIYLLYNFILLRLACGCDHALFADRAVKPEAYRIGSNVLFALHKRTDKVIIFPGRRLHTINCERIANLEIQICHVTQSRKQYGGLKTKSSRISAALEIS
jgi:hypothetical protein